MKRKGVLLIVALTILFLSRGLPARPTTGYEAQMVVTGWLHNGFQPLGARLGRKVMNVESFADADNRTVYHVVYLRPSGFVIVPADDSVEPIVGFTTNGVYDPSTENPLGALVTADLNERITAAVGYSMLTAHPSSDESRVTSHADKWRDLIDRAENPRDGYAPMSLVGASDVRVIPLLQSEWGQTTICGQNCYNYYVPNHYPSGCLATAMAQVMRYFRYPEAGIGVHNSEITVDGVKQNAKTRGGDGLGGPYRWDEMVLRPESNCAAVTEAQRQAIGALCYDAGVAVEMYYDRGGSASLLPDGRSAMLNVFRYSNAVMAYNSGRDISEHLKEIINPNLDAKSPVILAIINPGNPSSGHAVVCDGYGYESSTLYHHLNMGWEGISDIWYNLPDIDSAGGQFTSVFGCIYNVQVSGKSGEIISGRVLDADGRPSVNVPVYAQHGGQTPDTATTDARGIYAFVGLDPDVNYTVWPEAEGYIFSSRSVRTGRSRDGAASSGNHCGVDFTTESVSEPPSVRFIFADDDAPGDPRPGDPTESDPLEDGSAEHPFDAIQEAIDMAVPGDIVIILAGTYTGDANRDLDFKGKAITVRGEDPNEPGLVKISCQGNVDDPHRGFDFHSYETPLSVLEGVTVTGGYFEQGGGVYCEDYARPTIVNCTFEHNSASLGGAMYNRSAGPAITHCTFGENTAEAGGAVYNYGELGVCNPVLTGCIFYDNLATYNGGAMYNIGQYAEPVISDCAFLRNVTSAGGGGAIRNNTSAAVTLTRCLLTENSALTFGGAIRCSIGSSMVLTNCTLSGNSAGNGNALACTLDEGRLRSSCSVDVLNCILWDGGSEIYNKDGSTITVTYSNLEGGAGNEPWPGEGNIDTDPYFADPANGDYHLMSQVGRWHVKNQIWTSDKVTSRCIDAGDPSSPIGLEPTPNGGIVNIGAYGGTAEASKSNHN